MRSSGAYFTLQVPRKDGTIDYGYQGIIGDPAAVSETPEPDGSSLKIYQSVGLIATSDVVEGLEIHVSASRSMGKLRQYWSRYLVEGILLQMGTPDGLYIESTGPVGLFYGRAILMDYDKGHHAAFRVYGASQDNNICPDYEARFISVEMLLYSESSGLSAYSSGDVPPNDRGVWLPIDEALQVSTPTFYHQVMADPSVCYKPRTVQP